MVLIECNSCSQFKTRSDSPGQMETDRISFDIQLDIRNCWHCFKDIFDADFPDYEADQADSFLVPLMQYDIVHQNS